MNRDQFVPKQNIKPEKNENNDDGEQAYYFDCELIDKLQQDAKYGQQELKADKNVDLFQLINQSDFSSVGGQSQQAKAPVNNIFDFEEFNTNTIA